jgi:hypothetical protein
MVFPREKTDQKPPQKSSRSEPQSEQKEVGHQPRLKSAPNLPKPRANQLPFDLRKCMLNVPLIV